MLRDTAWQGHMHTWCTRLCMCTHLDCHSHAHVCSEGVRRAVVGGKETSGHLRLSWPVGPAELEPGPGLAGLDATGSPKHLSFHPAAASVFPTLRNAHFSQSFSEAFPGSGPGCGQG